MIIEQIVNSIFTSNTWIIRNEKWKFAWLVDCGDADLLRSALYPAYDLKGIFLTHSHFDHIYGLNDVLRIWPKCFVYTNEYGYKALLSDKLNFSRYHEKSFELMFPENVSILTDRGKVLLCDDIELECIYTPGHDPSCFCYRLKDCLFTGDSYIPGVKVVTNLRGGNKEQQMFSQNTIELELESCSVVYPGHNSMKLVNYNK